MNPISYLNNCVEVGNYQFMQVYTARPGDEFPGIFPAQYFMGKEIFISPTEARTNGLENGLLLELKLTELKEANDNNVFVLVTFG